MVTDIWSSFRRMPGWVQIWVAFILAPVNVATLAMLAQPWGGWVAGLAIGGMLPNLAIMAYERGLSKLMALPHILIWTPLVIYLGALLAGSGAEGGISPFLAALFVVNAISLAFDFPDFIKWLRGDRAIA